MSAKFDTYADGADWIWVRVGDEHAPYLDLTPTECREFAQQLVECADFAEAEVPA